MKLIAASLTILLATGLSGPAALGQNGAADSGVPTVSVTVNDAPLTEFAKQLTEKSRILVVADAPESAVFSGSFNNIGLEQLLNVSARTLEGSWRKVFLPSDTPRESMAAEAIRKAALMDWLADSGNAVIYDPATKSAVTIVRRESAESSETPSGMVPVYVLKAPGKQAVVAEEPELDNAEAFDAYVQLERRQNDQFLRLSPQDRVRALEHSLSMDLIQNPAASREYMAARAQAFRDLYRSNSPVLQQWRDLRRDAFGDAGMRGRGGGRGTPGR